ncbi:hypothetical protein CEQ90_10055 [Lewinellaceae bacterium SD302]|nr:hypothetical protein CEQ90_10055 [Lewinellaceae bacterium SD302]
MRRNSKPRRDIFISLFCLPNPARMLSLRITLFLFCVFAAFTLSAQEICDNGFDDDGDGLIDLNDTTDCACDFISVVESLFPNPSFDEFSNDPECASSQSNGAPDGPGQANCIAGWQQASEATTDAWHLLTYNGNPPNWPGAIPQPIPSGVAVAGFFTAVESVDGYREYFGACLPEGNTEIGEEYRLNIQLGFGDETTNGFDEIVFSPETIELAIYGILDCNDIPFASNQCPEVAGANGWELITTFTVTAAAVPGWEDVMVDFTTDENYAALAFGGTCDPVTIPPEFFLYRHYYFVDDIILNTVEEFENTLTVGGISVEGDDICSDDARMFVQPFDGVDVTYQWYRNGVAIAGETGLEYFPPLDENFNGTYTCRITSDEGCGVAGPVDLVRPVVTNAFQDSVYFCDGFVEIIPNVNGGLVQSYLWDDGSTEPNLFVTETGIYSVTVTSFCEETVETIVVTDETEPSYEWVIEPEIYCQGDTITTYLSSDWQLQLFVFGIPGGGDLLEIGDTATFILDEPIFLQLSEFGFSCFTFEDESVFLDPSAPNVAVQDGLLDCSGDPFTATLTGIDFDPDLYNFEWRDESGNLIGVSDTVYLNIVGNYSLSLFPSDGSDCSFTTDFSVSIDPNDLLVTAAEVPTLGCTGAPETISVTLDDPASTQSFWTFGQSTLATDTAAITISEAGEYGLTVLVINPMDPTDTFCIQQYSYTVTFDDTELLVESASVPELSCESPEDTLSVSLTHPEVTTLVWSFDGSVLPTNDPDLVVNVNGTYNLEAISLSNGGDTLCRQQYSYEVLFSPADLLVTSAEVPILDCSTREAELSVELSDPEATNLIWSSAGEQLAINVDQLIVSESGDYQLSAFLLGDAGDTLCRQEYAYTVTFEETEVPVDLQTMVDDNCTGTYRADFIRTTALDGWATAWFENDSLLPFATATDSLTDLSAGSYSLRLDRDDGLCSQTVAFDLEEVALLTLTGEVLNLECPTPEQPVQSGGLNAIGENGTAPYQFYLLNDNGRLLDSNSTGIFLDLPEGDFQLEVKDDSGCAAVIDSPLTISFPDLLVVEAGTDQIIKLGESGTLRAQTGGPEVDTIIWSPAIGLSCTDCLNPTVTPIENNVYTVTVISTQGACPATDSVFVGVDATGQVYVPNAFSPNLDGVNDDFRFFPDQSYAELLEFRVYNRWGGEVFVADNEQSTRAAWNGNAVNGKACDSGVYVYLLRVRLLNGEERKLTGAVNLLR